MTHINFFRGDFGVKKGIKNGPSCGHKMIGLLLFVLQEFLLRAPGRFLNKIVVECFVIIFRGAGEHLLSLSLSLSLSISFSLSFSLSLSLSLSFFLLKVSSLNVVKEFPRSPWLKSANETAKSTASDGDPREL